MSVSKIKWWGGGQSKGKELVLWTAEGGDARRIGVLGRISPPTLRGWARVGGRGKRVPRTNSAEEKVGQGPQGLENLASEPRRQRSFLGSLDRAHPKPRTPLKQEPPGLFSGTGSTRSQLIRWTTATTIASRARPSAGAEGNPNQTPSVGREICAASPGGGGKGSGRRWEGSPMGPVSALGADRRSHLERPKELEGILRLAQNSAESLESGSLEQTPWGRDEVPLARMDRRSTGCIGRAPEVADRGEDRTTAGGRRAGGTSTETQARALGLGMGVSSKALAALVSSRRCARHTSAHRPGSIGVACARPARRLPSAINFELPRVAVRSPPCDSGGGPSGSRPQRIRDAMVLGLEDALLRQTTAFANIMARGRRRPQPATTFTARRLLPYRRKAAGLSLWAKSCGAWSAARSTRVPLHVACGCETAVHACWPWPWLCTRPTVGVQLISHQQALDSCRAPTRRAAHGWGVRQLSPLGPEPAEPSQGVQQGDPAGPLLSSLLLHRALVRE